MMTDHTQWLARLGMRHPVIQAPMAGVSTPALAAEVSKAGGLGSLALGPCSPDQGEELIAHVQSLTDRPVNVNLFCHQPTRSFPELDTAWLDHLRPEFARFDARPPTVLHEIYASASGNTALQAMVLRCHPDVVSFHFGLPDLDFIHALRARGILTLACVTSLDEARQADRAGVDVLIAQGVEAGGHRGCFTPAHDGELSTSTLVSLLARETGLPLVAAGGIMDGAGIAEMLALGASAVLLGTAFVLCPESSADPTYRAALRRQSVTLGRLRAPVEPLAPDQLFEPGEPLALGRTLAPGQLSEPGELRGLGEPGESGEPGGLGELHASGQSRARDQLLAPLQSVDPTGITAAISGRRARGLINRFHQVGRTYHQPLPGYPRTYEAGKALHRAAAAQGCDDYAAHWAGQGAPLIREMPAAALVETLADELERD